MGVKEELMKRDCREIQEYKYALPLVERMKDSVDRHTDGVARLTLLPYSMPYRREGKSSKATKFLKKLNLNAVFIRDPHMRAQVANREVVLTQY